MEKIVEKVVVMPQIVEVVKYIHEIAEKNELSSVIVEDVLTKQ
jgi:hypothetical protein